MTLTYKDLTDQDAILILKYEVGAFALNMSCNGHYETDTVSPRPNPDPTDLLMSYLLGLDFRTEVYDKYSSQHNVRPGHVGFIGDDLRSIVWDRALTISRFSIMRVDQAQLDELRGLVQRVWADFKKHHKLEEFAEPTVKPCQYVPSGVMMDGQMLYKRVEEK